MRWESGEGLRRRALADRGDAKPGGASTYNQITINNLFIKSIIIPLEILYYPYVDRYGADIKP